jgi:general secretion pathway protein G
MSIAVFSCFSGFEVDRRQVLVIACQCGSGRKRKKTMKRFSRGVTLIELLIGIAILVILTGIAVANVGRLLQKTKVQAAKSTMGGIGLALDMVKTDTGLYPATLDDINEASAPSGFSPRNWRGPYAETISLDDPWGNQYCYELDMEEGVVFGPQSCRAHKPPSTETFVISAVPGPGTLTVQSALVPIPVPRRKAEIDGDPQHFLKRRKPIPGPVKPGASGRIWLNGEEIVGPSDFKKGSGAITKSVVLLSSNKIEIGLKNGGIRFSISGYVQASQSKDTTYTLKSYGKDGGPDGTGYNADIVYGQD